jgi:hypothetical protein
MTKLMGAAAALSLMTLPAMAQFMPYNAPPPAYVPPCCSSPPWVNVPAPVYHPPPPLPFAPLPQPQPVIISPTGNGQFLIQPR